MKMVDLSQDQCSLAEALRLAKSEPVLIRSASGEDFLLEPADDVDREVAALAGSEKFAAFLEGRSQETGDLSISQVRQKRGM